MHSLSTIIVRLAALGSLFFACMAPVPPLSGQAAPSSVPDPLKLEFVWEEVVTLGPSSPVGATPRGKRNIVPITGGTFEGPHIKGKILPGGWDWQLNAGGCISWNPNCPKSLKTKCSKLNSLAPCKKSRIGSPALPSGVSHVEMGSSVYELSYRI
jgi:hypothetical protein